LLACRRRYGCTFVNDPLPQPLSAHAVALNASEIDDVLGLCEIFEIFEIL